MAIDINSLPLQPRHHNDAEGLEIYLPAGAVGGMAGLNAFGTFTLKARGLLLEPDVIVGRYSGYTIERAQLWADAVRNGTHLTWEADDAPEWFYADPVFRLSLQEVGRRLGLTDSGVSQARQRNRLLHPICVTTPTPHDIQPRHNRGWDEDQVFAHGLKHGYIRPDGTLSQVSRGGGVRKALLPTAA